MTDTNSLGVLGVLHVSATVALRDGGPSVVVAELARELPRRGHRAKILTTDLEGDGRVHDRNATLRTMSDLDVEMFRARGPRRFTVSFGLWRALRTQVTSSDVVHIHGIYTFSSWVAAREARRAGVPYLVQPHGSLEHYHRRKSRAVKSVFDALVGRQMLRQAAGVVCTAESEVRAIADLVPVDRTHIVPLGAAVCAGDLEKPVLRDPYVLFLGRVTAKKRVDLLLDAWAEVVRDWHGTLVIAGEGELLAQMKAQAARALPPGRVVFLGHVEGALKSWLLRNASAFVLASENENFAISVAESLVAGVPVVVTPQVEMSTVVGRYLAGEIVELHAPAIAAGIRRLVCDPDHRSRCAEGAKAAASELSWANTAAAAEGMYTTVTQEWRNPHVALNAR
ncbi:MAG: glycosyltransferase [Propionibacteriales bacterium]|nr:glycosyltransferase [Propionibacteriales bacterium]